MEIDDLVLAMDIMTKAYDQYLKGEIGEESLLWFLEFSATAGCKEAQLLLDECKKYGVEKAMGKQQKKSTK